MLRITARLSLVAIGFPFHLPATFDILRPVLPRRLPARIYHPLPVSLLH